MDHSIYVPQQPVQLTITFESPSEAKDLLIELTSWTPTHGWGTLATQFFDMLKDCADNG